MPFVKLDTGILDSTLWIDKPQRDIFLTALLMAEPREFEVPAQQIDVGTLDPRPFSAPPGWYGFVGAAGIGIINRAGIDRFSGMEALRSLGEPEAESRSKAFEGRRMIRIDGGYLILNYMKFRDRDYTTAERSRRYRERKRILDSHAVASRDSHVTSRKQKESREGEGERERETSAKTRRQAAPLDLTLPDWVSKSSWDAFTEIRKNKRNPIRTQRQFDLLIKELAGLRVQGFDPTEMIDLAVMRGWQSFYAPKGENHNGNGKSRTDLAAESLIRESEQKSRDH